MFSFWSTCVQEGWTPPLRRRNSLFTSYSPFSTLSYFCKSDVVPICLKKIEVYNSSLGFWVLEIPIGVYFCYIYPIAVAQVSKFMMKIFSDVKCVSWNSFHATYVKNKELNEMERQKEEKLIIINFFGFIIFKTISFPCYT